jgi:hypothetical protein
VRSARRHSAAAAASEAGGGAGGEAALNAVTAAIAELQAAGHAEFTLSILHARAQSRAPRLSVASVRTALETLADYNRVMLNEEDGEMEIYPV